MDSGGGLVPQCSSASEEWLKQTPKNVAVIRANFQARIASNAEWAANHRWGHFCLYFKCRNMQTCN